MLDESSTSGSIDGVQNETTQAVDSRVRLLETDPLVLHVLPSTVSDDGKIQVYVRTFNMQTHLHACITCIGPFELVAHAKSFTVKYMYVRRKPL